MFNCDASSEKIFVKPNRSIARFRESFGGWSVMCVELAAVVESVVWLVGVEGGSTISHESDAVFNVWFWMGGRSRR
jgi:hypothetical protein